MTQFGLCCTFNYYAIDSIDYSNTTDQHSPPTPRRVASCGYQTALTVLLNNDLEDYYSTAIASYGSLHSPPTPRRVASCGYQTALTVLLNNDLEDYYSTAIASYGSLILIDNAYNLPELDSPTRLVSPSMEMFIALTPERTYATKGVSLFLPEQRKCYFNTEEIVTGKQKSATTLFPHPEKLL
ncbi:hypothetical protein JYU34_000302 [Plutella xylostella]|uniref:Uncharacterized protein n=1 Tax=Plutella xylostella TaxID=51655 RepID=A0ABQ7R7C7_PLUXY|nr:hypothetical protein JYU34_000302 [Plutella xylostella]